MARRFGQAHVARDLGLEHAVAQMLAHLVGHLPAQIVARVHHREDDTFECQTRIQTVADALDGVEQTGQSLERVVLGL